MTRRSYRGWKISSQRTRGLLAAATCLGVLVVMTAGCHLFGKKESDRPSFDGVTAAFTLTRSRIKTDQKLEARVVFRNHGEQTVTFRFNEPSVDARLYAKGEDLGILCPTADNPIFSVTLKPGEIHDFKDELYITRCYKLAPGHYSIRFNYNLRLLADKSLRAQYEEKYNHPYAGVVPWDGRDHPFTVVK